MGSRYLTYRSLRFAAEPLDEALRRMVIVRRCAGDDDTVLGATPVPAFPGFFRVPCTLVTNIGTRASCALRRDAEEFIPAFRNDTGNMPARRFESAPLPRVPAFL